MKLSTGSGDIGSGRMTASEAKDLMAALEEFLDNCTTDEAGGTNDENEHISS